EKVFYIPSLAVLIQHRSFRIITDLCGSDLMDDLAPRLNSPALVFARLLYDYTAHGLDNFLKGSLHVPGLQDFVLAPFEMKAQNGDAPLINDVRIDFAVAIIVWNHFTAA